MNLSAEALIRLQITLEYNLDSEGHLVAFPGSEEQAVYIVYRHAGGWVAFQRAGLPPSVTRGLAALPPESAASRPQALLAQAQLAANWGHFLAYYFPTTASLPASPSVERQGNDFVILQAGQRVAWAWSVRENARCAEVAVETLPKHRRRGYAAQIAAAWVRSIIESGRVAFYSHKASNLASAGLARRLGAEYFADCFAFE